MRRRRSVRLRGRPDCDDDFVAGDGDGLLPVRRVVSISWQGLPTKMVVIDVYS